MTSDLRHDRDFIDRTEAVVRMGAMLLAAGTGSYRVKRAMDRTAAALGMDRHDAAVTLTDITMTVHAGDNFRTVCRQVHRIGVDASRIDALEKLSRDLRPGVTAIEVEQRLDDVSRHVAARWRTWQSALAAGVGCAAFAVLNRSSVPDACVVALAAFLGQAVRRQLARRQLNQFGAAAVSAAVAALVYVAVVFGLQHTAAGVLVSDAGYIASMLFLVPGFPMITSLLDMARMDFSAGIARACYAAGIVVAATLSAWLVSYLAGLTPWPAVAAYHGTWFWLSSALATFLGVAGFAVLFNSTPRMVLGAASIATVGNLLRIALVALGAPHQLAALVGGVVIGLGAAVATRPLRVSRITLSVPAAIIMIPGATIYRTMYWLNAADVGEAITEGADAVLTVLAIALGLAAARMVTDPGWAVVEPVASPHAFRDPEDW